jgi:hypothetical protein
MIRAISPIVVALVLASCGGEDTGATGSIQPTSGAVSGQPSSRCTSLTSRDIARVASIRPSEEQALASSPGVRLRCSILFIDSSGQLILQLTEAGGGRAALADLRRAAASDVGAAAVRPLPALGNGAFVARRVLAFARGRSVVQLQTGYSADGRLQLTPSELTRLATIASAAS